MKWLVGIYFLLLLSSCLEGGECFSGCYQGAPVLRIELVPKEISDSIYQNPQYWRIRDGNQVISVRYEQDTTFQYIDLYMAIESTDSSFLIYGDGVTWNHLDDLQGETYLLYGNGDVDTFKIELSQSTNNCCLLYYIKSVRYNGDSLRLDSTNFYKAALVK
ncbi:MAG: hypothetical protein RIC35_06000 [Marinoscillum sp.]